MLTEKIQLEADEIILHQVRKHWFILFVQVLGILVAALFPLFAFGALTLTGLFNSASFTLQIGTPAILILYVAWILLLWMALFNIWTNYYLDVWTITTKRLIAIDQRGLFHRNTGSFRLERLQDLNVEIHGIIATLLNFGTLEAETAGGDDDKFKAYGLPDPRGLKSAILKASDELMHSHNPNRTMQDGI